MRIFHLHLYTLPFLYFLAAYISASGHHPFMQAAIYLAIGLSHETMPPNATLDKTPPNFPKRARRYYGILRE